MLFTKKATVLLLTQDSPIGQHGLWPYREKGNRSSAIPIIHFSPIDTNCHFTGDFTPLFLSDRSIRPFLDHPAEPFEEPEYPRLKILSLTGPSIALMSAILDLRHPEGALPLR